MLMQAILSPQYFQYLPLDLHPYILSHKHTNHARLPAISCLGQSVVHGLSGSVKALDYASSNLHAQDVDILNHDMWLVCK